MFGVRLSKMGSASKLGLIAKAIGILRSYGADAHVYLPGIGTVNGLTAGNYLDSAGTTAATVDNPVGLSLDALQAMTLGANLVVNGTFDIDANWIKDANWSISGGVATSNGGAGLLKANVAPLVIGNTYQVTFTIKRYVAGAVWYPYSGYDGVPAPASAGTYTINHIAGTADLYLYSNAFNGDVDDVIVKQIPGIHATQATTANKPILRRGLLNLLTYSQDTSNVAWVKTQATISSGIADPLGGTNARRIVEQSGAITNAFITNFASKSAASLPYTSASIVKAAGRNFAWVQVSDGAGNGCRAFVSIVDGAITSAAATHGTGFSAPAASVLQIYPGWWLISVSGTTNTAAVVYNHTGISNDGTTFAYTGNGTSGINTFGSGIFAGTYTAQQIIDAGGIPLTTSAAASNPSAGKYSWQFDGINDSLSLSAPLFQMSDDHAVIAGFNAAVANKYLFSQANSGTVSQLCSLRVDVTGFPGVVWIDDATANALLYGTVSCIGINTVASAIKIGNAKRFRVNGMQSGATDNTVLGTTTLNTYSIGSLNGASSNFQGLIYPVIAIKGTVSDSDLLTLERFVGQLSGVSI